MSTSIYDVYEAEGAKRFLDSIGRNSSSSKKAYCIGLTHFQRFLNEKMHTLQSIIKPLRTNEINVYELLDEFVSYQLKLQSLGNQTIKLYVSAVRSYLQYYDIDVVPSKFKKKVKLPKISKEDEAAIDAADIRKILLVCNNRRLKSFLLVLASGAMRAAEALAMRLRDIDFSISPTKVHIRKEYSKTRVARDIYISDEATQYLKQWIDWKYRTRTDKIPRTRDTERLVFAVYEGAQQTPETIYRKMNSEFNRVLAIAGFGERKEGVLRHKITLHSFRRFVKTVIANQVNSDFSEGVLGHSKSSYYTLKEPARREIYATKCMPQLTFLDYTVIESTSRNIETKLSESQVEVQNIKKELNEIKREQQEFLKQFSRENLPQIMKYYELRAAKEAPKEKALGD